jgi:thiamine-phosphate pyrophosphorylase
MIDRSAFGLVMVTSEEPLPLRATVEALRAAVQRHRPGLLLLRRRDLGEADYLEIAVAVVEALPIPVILHGHPALVAQAGAVGVHLGHGTPRTAEAREAMGPGPLLGVSVHGVLEGEEQALAGADYLLFGPVRATVKQDYARAPIGWGPVAELASRVPVPVVGIGGLGPADRATALSLGAAGIAGIRAFRSDAPRAPHEL